MTQVTQATQRTSTARAGSVPGADVTVRCAVAATLAGAAIVHATVVGEHLVEWAPAGLFFLALVLVEGSLGSLALLAWSREVCLLIAGTGVATVAVWAVSRTVGMPIGPADFRVPEAVGRADVVCGIFELVAAAVCVLSLASRSTAPGSISPQSRLVRGALAGAIVAIIALVTAFAVAPALSAGGEEHHHGDAAHAAVLRAG